MFGKLVKKLASTVTGRLWLVPVVFGACAWSQFTYIFSGVPKEKKPLYDNWIGWTEREMERHWQELLASGTPDNSIFHNLKNVGVEWMRANAQPAAKLGSLLLYLGWSLWVISTLVFSLLFLL
jgi:hypothetical protein